MRTYENKIFRSRPGLPITPEKLLEIPDAMSIKMDISWVQNDSLLLCRPSKISVDKTELELIDLSTGNSRFLSEGDAPKVSPDGKWIAFTKGEERQMWIIKSDGSELRCLIKIPGGLSTFVCNTEYCWSSDSSRIALKHQTWIDPWEKGKRPEAIIEVINIHSGESQKVATVDARVMSLSWFHSEEKLLFSSQRPSDLYGGMNDSAGIYSVNILDGKIEELKKFDGLQQFLSPALSSNDENIAFLYDADFPEFTYLLSIGLLSQNGETKRLTEEIKFLPFSIQWSPDGQFIFGLRNYGAYNQICSVNIKTGEISTLTDEPYKIKKLLLSPDGARIVWTGEDPYGSHVVKIITKDGKNSQEIFQLLTTPSDIALSEIREIAWDTKNYPEKMRGLLVLPLNYEKGKKYPLVVDIHGGGHGASIYFVGGILVKTPLEWQLWTAKGCAVFVPEMRSSAAFGSLAIRRDHREEKNAIECDILDIETGVQELIEQGIADANRMAIIGHSAGARRANWLTVTRQQFKMVISKEGWADEMIYTAIRPYQRGFDMHGGSPLEVPHNYLKNSALFHSHGAKTPTLFLMGNPEHGGADPIDTVLLLHKSLKEQGIKTEYIKYSDEGHCFEKLENLKDALSRCLQWLDNYLDLNKEERLAEDREMMGGNFALQSSPLHQASNSNNTSNTGCDPSTDRGSSAGNW